MTNAQELLLTRLGVLGDSRVVSGGKAGSEGAGIAVSENPATGDAIAGVRLETREQYDATIRRAVIAQRHWRQFPGPQRGEIVRQIGLALREKREDLGALVSLEMGKIRAEGIGEVQECVDIADFAVGLSRQMYGLTMPSERPNHRMMEQWHPLGVVGVITAFNFPIAVWGWNAMLAAVCGDALVWKPSLLTPLIAVAANKVAQDVMRSQELFRIPASEGAEPADVFSLTMGTDKEIGETLIADRRLPLISATGSCRMGRRVGVVVAERLGRTLLELGGNNAIIVMPDADLDLTLRGVVFGSVGTAGQRCTSTRRLLCVGDTAQRLAPRLVDAYKTVRIGDPLAEGTLMGPLITKGAVEQMKAAITAALSEGCEVLSGGLPGLERMASKKGNFVEPTIIRVPKGKNPKITQEETFAPVLYVFECESFDEAMALHNSVPQGLSSAVFTDSVRTAETFLSAAGSDCGIANVNLGTSGAEIGGAFGGEKDTGGGRESGSDAWKAYMRRQTCTVNYGTSLPLAQGISFQ